MSHCPKFGHVAAIMPASDHAGLRGGTALAKGRNRSRRNRNLANVKGNIMVNTMSKNLLPVLNLNGLVGEENTHEKYGTTLEIKCSGKTGKYPSINVEVAGKGLCKLSIGSKKTEAVDSNGDAIWVPVLRVQEIAASVPKKVEAKVSTKDMPKVSADEQKEYADFLAFRAMRAQAAK